MAQLVGALAFDLCHAESQGSNFNRLVAFYQYHKYLVLNDFAILFSQYVLHTGHFETVGSISKERLALSYLYEAKKKQ